MYPNSAGEACESRAPTTPHRRAVAVKQEWYMPAGRYLDLPPSPPPTSASALDGTAEVHVRGNVYKGIPTLPAAPALPWAPR